MTTETDRDAVIAANSAFYEAFRARDLDALGSLIAEHAPVACTHPGWSALTGREQVLVSWKAILLGPHPPDVEHRNPRVQLYGEDAAAVICTEVVAGTLLTATNVFVREDGSWRMVHHHASPIMQVVGEPPSEDAEPEVG